MGFANIKIIGESLLKNLTPPLSFHWSKLMERFPDKQTAKLQKVLERLSRREIVQN